MSIKDISYNRSVVSYSRFRNLYSILIRNNKLQLLRSGLNNKKYANIGCGERLCEYMINIDYYWIPGLDLCWNITKGLPLRNQSLYGIFTEHCLEHIPFNYVLELFSEFKRVSKKDSIIRIIVPDGELYLNEYLKSRNNKLFDFPYGIPKIDLVEGTPMMAVNSIFNDYSHKFVYDYETLEKLLKYSGFNRVKKEKYMKGSNEDLLIDWDFRACESLYVEAIV